MVVAQVLTVRKMRTARESEIPRDSCTLRNIITDEKRIRKEIRKITLKIDSQPNVDSINGRLNRLAIKPPQRAPIPAARPFIIDHKAKNMELF